MTLTWRRRRASRRRPSTSSGAGNHPPDRARLRQRLPRQWPRGPGARRADAVRRSRQRCPQLARWSARAASARWSAQAGGRRAILEEAAGITGLSARRHEAELKLRATEANLRARRGSARPGRNPARPAAPGAPGGRYRNISGDYPHRRGRTSSPSNKPAPKQEREAARTALAAARIGGDRRH